MDLFLQFYNENVLQKRLQLQLFAPNSGTYIQVYAL